MEFSKLAERKYIWNFNNGSFKRQQRKISNSFTSFHHTAYLENITNLNNGYKKLHSSNQALPPIPYIIPKQIKVLNSFLNCSNTSCKPNANFTPRKSISKKLENEQLLIKTDITSEIETESIPKEAPEHVSNPSQKDNDQVLRIQNKVDHTPKPEKNELDVILKKNSETHQKLEGEEKGLNSNALGFDENLKQNTCGAIMKNLISQLTCAEQLFHNSHEKNQKKIETSSKLPTEDNEKFKSDLPDDNCVAKDVINMPFMSKRVSNLRKIFEQKESQETIPNSNYSSNSSCHNRINVNWNSKHVDLSKLNGNCEATKIQHSACLNSTIIDKIKEKVFSASKESNNNQNYIHQNNTLKFPKETSMAMKLLLNKRMVGLNESNINNNLENALHSQRIRAKKKPILKNDPNFPCHKNLLCTKGGHSGRCDLRPTNSTKICCKNCQASWSHSNNYYEGDLDLLNNCLNLTFRTN